MLDAMPNAAQLPGGSREELTSRGFAIVEHSIHHALEDFEGSTRQTTAGIVLLEFPQVRHDRWWLIERVVVKSSSAVPTDAEVYVMANAGALKDLQLRDLTTEGVGDVAEYAQPIPVPPGQAVFIRWPDLTAAGGARCVGIIQYSIAVEVLRRVKRNADVGKDELPALVE